MAEQTITINWRGIAQRCHKLLDRFNAMPTSNIEDKLLIVSLPHWMELHDIDLIKKSLEHYAEYCETKYRSSDDAGNSVHPIPAP
jgi:hypothetical protein